jgi:WD40 repeat protein
MFAVGAIPGLRLFRVVRESNPVPTVTLRPLEIAPPAKGDVGCLIFSPDNSLFVWTTNQGVIHVWDLQAGRELPSPGSVLSRIQSLAFLPDGRLLFVNPERRVEIWDLRNGRATAAFSLAKNIPSSGTSYTLHIGLSPDGRRLAASSMTGRGVDIWDTATGKLLVPLPEEKGTVWCMAWSPDGERLAVCRSNGRLAIWNYDSVRSQLQELGVGW